MNPFEERSWFLDKEEDKEELSLERKIVTDRMDSSKEASFFIKNQIRNLSNDSNLKN